MTKVGKSVLALSGGVGGAKLALGLADILPPGQLHVVVNTADDFRHLGLHISPDIDTLLYTLLKAPMRYSVGVLRVKAGTPWMPCSGSAAIPGFASVIKTSRRIYGAPSCSIAVRVYSRSRLPSHGSWALPAIFIPCVRN